MKFKKLLLALLILPLFLLTGCKENELEKVSQNLSTYSMDIVYNEDHTLSVKQNLEFKNNYDTTLDSLMFHLYPRSFRQGAKSSVVSTLNYNKCYYNGSSYGDIEITSVSLNNTPVEHSIIGNDEDIAKVNLTSPLAPGDISNIYFEYTVTIPNINHRFGYGEDTINVGNFYPIMCMYEDGDYVIDSYHYNGDPFYSDMANYNVNITTPIGLTLASTGDVVNTTSTEDTQTTQVKALAVRDFAFVLSGKYTLVSDKYNNTTINYYYYNNQYPNEAIKAGVDSIRTFSEMFGEYPYSTINIVESDFVHGGMEYPGLVLISDMVDVQSDYINVIVHEIAHQWWYGVVGNNEYHYAWLDEGLTEYSTLLFYEANPKYNVNTKELIKNTNNSYATFIEVYKKVFSNVDTTMNRKLNEYNNESEYVYITYVKGMLLFDSLREVMGKEKFIKALQTYYSDNKYKIATPDNLINSFEKSSKTNLRELFSSWIDGKVKIMPMA